MRTRTVDDLDGGSFQVPDVAAILMEINAMTCKICGGPVTWRGPIGRLEFTQCAQCHAVNCQIETDEPETPEEREVYQTIWGQVEFPWPVEMGGES